MGILGKVRVLEEGKYDGSVLDIETIPECLQNIIPEYNVLIARRVDMDDNVRDSSWGCRRQIVFVYWSNCLDKQLWGIF